MIDWQKVAQDLEKENKELKKRLEQREWVGLTAKDLVEIPSSAYEGAIWADAKLKEKNNGTTT